PRLQMAGDRRTHCQQCRISLGIVEQIRRHHHIKGLVYPQLFDVLHQIVNPETVALFLTASQIDHPVRDIDPDHSSGPATVEESRVEAFAARKIEDGLATQVTQQLEEREMLQVQAPRLLLGALVFLRNLVVVCCHAELLVGEKKKKRSWPSG